MNNEQNIKTAKPTVSTTKILAIGHLTEKAMNEAARGPVMLNEVPATVRLYLDGKIEQWWIKPDLSGVVFILNLTDTKEAHNILEALPLGVAGMMVFDLIPLGPLAPLRILLND